MGRRLIGITIICILAITALPSVASAWEGLVVSVSSGDTIKVMRDGKQVKIRLAAIDCPEKGQPYGQAARRFTSNLVSGKFVEVWKVDKQPYGHIVAFVFTDKVSINKALLEAGLAWHYKKYDSSPYLASIEMKARTANRGLWKEPNPEPPWEYRKRKENN